MRSASGRSPGTYRSAEGRNMLLVRTRATPPHLVPHEAGRPPEARQVDQLHPGAVFDCRPSRTANAARPWTTCLDVYPHRPTRPLRGADHVHVTQPDQAPAHARRVPFHRDSPARRMSEPSEFGSPCTAPGGPLPHSSTLLGGRTRPGVVAQPGDEAQSNLVVGVPVDGRRPPWRTTPCAPRRGDHLRRAGPRHPRIGDEPGFCGAPP